MNLKRLVLSVAVVSVAVATVSASGPLGIYGIVEKVVFEPNEQAPERIQVWGAFSYFEGRVAGQSLTISKPARGYLYFRLGGQADAVVKNEWADLKSVAGTGQAVGFGQWGYVGGFGSLQTDERTTTPPYILERAPTGGRSTDLRVRPATETPAAPALYQTDSGVVKLSASGSHAEIVQRLREALKR